MSGIVSAAIVGKLADFGVKVLIRLGIKFNNGPFHRHVEKRRRAQQMREMMKNEYKQ
jgi:hypothetical protein